MRTIAILLVYAAVLALGTYNTFRPTFDSGFVRVQTERGDGMLNHLILENSWLALTDPNYKGTLLTPPFYFPARGTLLYSENLFGAAPVYWALRCVTDHEFAYIWWQIVCNALNFAAFGIVCRWFKMPHVLALTGAFLWAFAVVHVDQIKHSQMIPRFFMPFTAYYAAMLVLEPSAKALNRMLATLFLQCLACVYTGWFLAVGLVAFVPALVLLQPGMPRYLWRYAIEHRLISFSFIAPIVFIAKQSWRYAIKRKTRVDGVLVLWTGAMLALFGPYVVINLGISRTYEDCYKLFPTPAAWFSAPEGTRWHRTLDAVRTAEGFECLLFSGFALYALALAACVHLPWFRKEGRSPMWSVAVVGLFTAGLWVLLTLSASQQGEYSPWRYVRHIPGGNAIRVVTRVYVIVYLFGTISILLWLAMVLERIKRPAVQAAILVPLLAVLVWEQTGFEQHTLLVRVISGEPRGADTEMGFEQHSFARHDFYYYVDQNAETLRGAGAGYVVPRFVDSNNVVSTGAYGEVFAMWVGMRANVPVLNGYSGRGPDEFPWPPTGALSDDDIKGWLKGKYRGTVRQIDSEAPGAMREIPVE